ncbi:MAG: ATP-binding protein [Rhizobiaceae bacterium]
MQPNTMLRQVDTGPSNNDPHEPGEFSQGHVIDCNGTHSIIAAEVKDGDGSKENYWAVGQLISIQEGENRVIGQAFKVDAPTGKWTGSEENLIKIHIELVGEIQFRGGDRRFTSGITNYPRMGASAQRIRPSDLEAIYKNEGDDSIKIGHVTQESSIPAKINLSKLLSRHFAVVGSTGVGKSTSVSLILRKIIEKRKELRVVILDPHNEFTSAFAEVSIIKDASNLQLPFWLFRFEELIEVIFRGQKGFDTEAEILRDLVVEAKERYVQGEEKPGALVRRSSAVNGYTADSPVPYRIVDLLKIIDEHLGMLDKKAEKPILKALHDRLSSISKDPRFQFMFGQSSTGGDRMKSIIADLFRIPQYDKPICIVEMSGLPSEVVSSVVSVLCRMAFDMGLASQGGVQTLVVCEEAHRYVPANTDAGFWPTRQAIAKIAKEGRKYGVYLGVITQRPSELDPTIFSQCNTVFAMRLSNQADQKIIGGAMTNGAQSTVGFLASIANQECIAFGEAIKTPMRLTFETIPKELLPGSNIYDVQEAVRNGREIDITDVVQRMRGGGSGFADADEIDLIEAARDVGVPQRENQLNGAAPAGEQRPQRQVQNPAANGYPSQIEVNSTPPQRQQSGGFSHQTPPAMSPPPPRRAPEPPVENAPRRGGNANDLISAFRSK